MLLATLFLVLDLITPAAFAAPKFVHAARDRCERLLADVTAFADRHVAVRSDEWTLAPETERRIADTWTAKAGSDVDRMNQTVRLIMTDRAEQRGGVLRAAFVKAAVHFGLNAGNLYRRTVGGLLSRLTGPHQFILTPFISMAPIHPDDPAYGIVAAHEINHAYDQAFHTVRALIALVARGWNLNRVILRNPFEPYLHNRFERASIGAQWEVARRIPAEARARLIARIESMEFADPVPAKRRAMYERVVASGDYGDFGWTLRRLDEAGLLPKRYFPAECLIVGWRERRGSPLREYRDALLALTAPVAGPPSPARRRAEALVGIDKLRRARGMILSLRGFAETVVPKPIDPKAHGPALESILKEHQRAHRGRRRDQIDVIAIESLNSAEMGKAEFIAHLEQIHGYALHNLFRYDILRFWDGPLRRVFIAQAIWVLTVGQGSFWGLDLQWAYDYVMRFYPPRAA